MLALSWLLPGNGDVPTDGVMANMPLSQLWISVSRTLSHTTGHRKAELVDVNSVVSNSSSMIMPSSTEMRILAISWFSFGDCGSVLTMLPAAS